MRIFSKASILLCSLFCCSQEPEVDANLYGTWMVIGIKNVINGYGTAEEKSYSVDNSLECYKISNNNLNHFVRGVDYSLFPLGRGIEFYDSTSVESYSAAIDENTITFDNILLSYSISNICGATLLKISRNVSGYDPNRGKITTTFSHYCIKVDKDSLPFNWPTEFDVTMPDTNCKLNTDDLDSW